MKFPKFLPDGGTIGFVAPSFGCATSPYQETFEHAIASQAVLATLDATQGFTRAAHAFKRRTIFFGGVAQSGGRDACLLVSVHGRPGLYR